jgi:hypothetical protein
VRGVFGALPLRVPIIGHERRIERELIQSQIEVVQAQLGVRIEHESARLERQQMQQGIVTLEVFMRDAGDAAVAYFNPAIFDLQQAGRVAQGQVQYKTVMTRRSYPAMFGPR